MTKADIVEEIVKVSGLPKKDIAMVVDAFLNVVSNALTNQQNIEIRGFGCFKTKQRKSRTARNPRTGEVVPVPGRIVPVFKPSNELKAKIKQS